MSSSSSQWIRIGLLTLPIYGVLTFLSTLTHQPDSTSDFPAYAEYITTTRFLISHLIGSIGATALAFLGIFALFALLVRTRSESLAVAGLVLSVIGNALILTLFGVAAFAAPAIGDAYLAGVTAAQDIDDSTYGTALMIVALIGTLSYSIGAIVFGVAMRRSAFAPRWVAILYGFSGPLISLVGLMIGVAQTAGSIALIIASGWIAWKVWRQPVSGVVHDTATFVQQGV